MSEKLKVRNAFPVGLYNATIRLSTIMCTYSLHLIVIKQALHATIDRITEKRNEINTIPCTWFPKYNTRNMSIVTNRLVMDVMVQKKTLIFLYTVGRTGKYTLTPHSQTQIKAIPHKERTAKRLGKRYNKEVKKQLTMSLISDELGQASTKKKEFLGIMEKLIPWSEWVGIVQPHYYKGERGNKPYDLELMLRIYVLQHLYNLADDAARNEIIDSRAFSQFCGVDSSNQVPDGDTIGRFRHILEQNQLGEAFFTNVVESLQKCNLMLKKGTIVDSTLIAAPSSTKNKEKQRDPEAHSVKKGNQWYFGYKEHIGVDADSGLVHTVETTAANVHDSNMVVVLLQGTEEDVYGDSGYLGAEKKDDAILVNNEGHPIRYQINKRPSQLKKASGEKFELLKEIEHAKSSVRSKVEHVFCVIKRIFHFCKTRFRGREKLHQHCCTLFALANLYLARNRMKVV